MDVSYTLPAVENSADNKAEAAPEIQSLSFEEYMVIAGKNTFHPDRIVPVEKVEKKDEKTAPPLPKPEIVLYGTLISDKLSLAYIEDKNAPVTTPGRGKRVRVAKKGEDIGGFILKEIKADSIYLVRGEEKMTVNLTSPSKKRESFSPQPLSPPKSSN